MRLKHFVAVVVSTVAVGALLQPCAAAAQDATSAPALPEDPRAPRYHEVERGFFTGFEVGYLTFFKTPTADVNKFPLAPNGGGTSSGMVVGANVGYDISSRVALSLFVLGGNSSADVSYGAFSVFATGGDLRLALLGSRDAQGVERLYVYVHGRGGLMLTRPEGLFGSSDTYLAAGPGIEYFTHLRHFSVGLAADFAYVTKAKATGLAVMPTVRYTF